MTIKTYTYVVRVQTDSAEHAAQVMSERLGYDEQYEDEDGVEFDYRIPDWEQVSPTVYARRES
jgi:hypothetical protein